MEESNREYYIAKARQLEELQKNKNCTKIAYNNPVVIYPVASVVTLLLSSLLTILKLETFNIILLPFKLLAGIIMILMFTISLVLICNFFSSTATWISAIIFFLITAVGAPVLIYFGLIALIIFYVMGISGTAIAGTMYYFKDSINNYFNNTSNLSSEEIEEVIQEAIEMSMAQETMAQETMEQETMEQETIINNTN